MDVPEEASLRVEQVRGEGKDKEGAGETRWGSTLFPGEAGEKTRRVIDRQGVERRTTLAPRRGPSHSEN
jgi:hypothetical protein